MSRRIGIFTQLLLVMAAPLPAQQECSYRKPVSVVSGPEDGGYSIRTDWTAEFHKPRKGSDISAVADLAAQEAAATVLYMTRYTERDLPRGEWRGSDPLSALKAFAAAAGLEVEVPEPGFWVIGTPEWNERSATTIFARPLDAEKQGFQPVEQVGELEKALVAQLPVREGCGRLRQCSIGVSYYWLPEEGPDVLLVQATVPRGSQFSPPVSPIFKVRANLAAPRVKIDCVWSSWATGPMVPDIAEDLDGDGYRDFVFDGVRYDGGYNAILSGRDGQRLAEFGGHELLVEKGCAGAKRIGVERVPEGVPTQAGGAARRGVVLAYCADKRSYEPASWAREVEGTTAGATPEDEERNTIDETRRAFAAAVGGTEKVRAYVLHNSPRPGTVRVEEVRVRDMRLDAEVTRKRVESGYPARILFEYKSPSYLAEQERRAREPVDR